MSKPNRHIYLPALALPAEFRDDLGKPQGTLIVHPERGVVHGIKVDVAVGDIVSQNHLSIVSVVDFKTKREVKPSTRQECHHLAVNPAGVVSINSITIADLASKGTICIIGEEDLLVVPFLRHEGKRILYGQPNTGVVLVEAKRETSIKAFKILKPTMVKYDIHG